MRAFVATVYLRDRKACFGRKGRVEKQAGERVGAVNGTRLGLHRTATPSVSNCLGKAE